MRTIPQTVSKSRAVSNEDRRRRPPLARARTLPSSRVQSVAMRLVSLQSVVRSTIAWALSIGGLPGSGPVEQLRVVLLAGTQHQRVSLEDDLAVAAGHLLARDRDALPQL